MNDTGPTIDPEVLGRLLAGDATPAEQAIGDAFLAAHPAIAATFAGARESGESDGVVPQDTLALEHARRRLALYLDDASAMRAFWGTAAPSNTERWASRPHVDVARGRLGKKSRVAMIATVTAFALLAGIVVNVIPWHGSDGSSRMTRSSQSTYVTHRGEMARVVLPDGGRAMLGPATTMRVYSGRSGTDVWLDGEALFAVAHRSAAPFIVHTVGAATRVLGTTFFVRRYDSDQMSRIAVREGRVAVRAEPSASHTIPLDHSMVVAEQYTVATVDDSGRVHVMSDADTTAYTAWVTGDLVFRRTPVHEIIADLGRAYDADIRLADTSLARRELTWKVSTRSLSLAGAMEALSAVLNAHVVRSGATLTIIPGALPVQKPTSPHPSSTTEVQYGR